MVANKISKKSDLHVAIIGDEETVSGFCLAGAGMRDGNGVTNFLVVDAKTRRNDIEDAFKTFVERPDIAIVIINQPIAEKIRHVVRKYTSTGSAIPTVLEIPSKEAPYNPAQDSIMQRVQMFFGKA